MPIGVIFCFPILPPPFRRSPLSSVIPRPLRAQAEVPFDRVRDARAGVTVAVGIDRVGHRRVGGGIVQQLVCQRKDRVTLHARELHRAGGDRLGALRLAPQDKHRLAECRSLLLQAAGVGHDHIAARHQVVHLVRAQRRDQMYVPDAIQMPVGALLHHRREMHRIDQLRLRVRPGKLCERGHDVLHRLSVILAPVTGHKDDLPARVVQLVELFCRKAIVLAYRCFQSVNDRVAGNEHALGLYHN